MMTCLVRLIWKVSSTKMYLYRELKLRRSANVTTEVEEDVPADRQLVAVSDPDAAPRSIDEGGLRDPEVLHVNGADLNTELIAT